MRTYFDLPRLYRSGLAAAAALLFAVPSFAQSAQELTGHIRYIDRDGGRILMSSNDFFNVGDQVDLSTLKVGQRVTLTYEGTIGETELTAIEVVPAPTQPS